MKTSKNEVDKETEKHTMSIAIVFKGVTESAIVVIEAIMTLNSNADVLELKNTKR